MGHDAHAQFIGTGPMEEVLRRDIARHGLAAEVTLSGFLTEPYQALSEADALVLPSMSEGLSRACMEALFLGAPCVMRAVDGNNALVRSGVNGVLFDNDEQIAAAMLQAAQIARSTQTVRTNLLPAEFRQATAAGAYLKLVEG
jgi:glycosyltransferase involved in cell wall biosynthesis